MGELSLQQESEEAYSNNEFDEKVGIPENPIDTVAIEEVPFHTANNVSQLSRDHLRSG